MAQSGHILFVDAHDSFAANIVALLRRLTGAGVTTIDIDHDIETDGYPSPQHSEPRNLPPHIQKFDAIIIGPGPGHPQNPKDVGVMPDIVRIAEQHKIPLLGICLGFQILCCTYGLPVVRLAVPCHGQVKQILHQDEDIFKAAGTVLAIQYNSLGVMKHFWKDAGKEDYAESACSTPSDLSSTSTARNSFSFDDDLSKQVPEESDLLDHLAWDKNGFLMAVKHKSLPFWGLQYHPESCRSNAACTVVLQTWWTAVLDWNKQHRDPLPGKISRATDATPPVLQPRDYSQTSLLSYILHLCESSGSKVHTSSVKIKCHLDQICELLQAPANENLFGVHPNRLAMLESTGKGRYSIYALPSRSTWQIEYRQGQCYVFHANGAARCFTLSVSSALECLELLTHHKKAHGGSDHIPFWGGLIGFCSYEGGLKTAGISTGSTTSTSTPDLCFLWTDRSIVVDKVERVAYVQSLFQIACFDDTEWVDDMSTLLENYNPPALGYGVFSHSLSDLKTAAQIILPNEEDYKSKIRTCQAELHAGNSYELCLTAEAVIKLPSTPFNQWILYDKLRKHNPVPYAALLHLNRIRILSSSPEQYLTWTRTGTIDMVPMKGTVQRTPTTTLASARHILSTPKESAENLMIADLIRHDLHNVVGTSPAASVDVLKLCDVVEHETVYQLVSHIRAKPPLPPSLTSSETQDLAIHYGHTALRTTLPPGSMTGAPKRRSCTILSSLEKRPRGGYSGVLGYMDVGGGGGFSVCIRTAFSNQDEDEGDRQTWRVGAGGAITVLSEVDAEWEEMRGKLQSVLEAFR